MNPCTLAMYPILAVLLLDLFIHPPQVYRVFITQNKRTLHLILPETQFFPLYFLYFFFGGFRMNQGTDGKVTSVRRTQ